MPAFQVEIGGASLQTAQGVLASLPDRRTSPTLMFPARYTYAEPGEPDPEKPVALSATFEAESASELRGFLKQHLPDESRIIELEQVDP